MFLPRRCLPSLAALAVLLSLVSTAALASVPRYADVMPIGQVKPGMKGYGLTVFRGTKIEKFQVTVVGVVKKGSLIVPGHDMILVKLAGGPITERKAFLIRGMSGSPVYVNGKIIGAFSMGEPTTKEPLGGVTPIEDMLEAWDPKLPNAQQTWMEQRKQETMTLKEPIVLNDRKIEKIVANAPLKSGLRSHDSTLIMHPCTTFMSFSGVSKAAREKLAKMLEPYNVELTQTASAGQKPGFKGAPLVPGAMFSMMFATGDTSAGAAGTISYRRGDRILGFGHPFLGIGAIEAPLCSAYVYDIYPLSDGSRKIWGPGPIVGTSSQDRNFAVSGYIGKMPKTIPVTVDVRDITTGRARVFRTQVVLHPNLSAGMISATVGSAIAEIHPTPGPTMARVSTTVEAEEIGKVSRDNVVFDARAIDSAATGDLDDLLGIFSSNPFYPVPVKSANVKVEIETGRKTAQVERIFLKEGRFEPGETAEVGIVIKPYKQPAFTRTVKVAIPQNTPTGRYVLQVRGGAVPPAISFGGLVIRSGAPQNPEQAPPTTIRQMVNRYDEREKNNDVVVRLVLPSTAVSVEGEKLSNLPPSLDAVMRSAKSSGVRMERDEVKVVQPTDYVISGAQVLALNVQKRETQETPSAAQSSTGSSSPPSTGGGGSNQTFDQEFSVDTTPGSPDDQAVPLNAFAAQQKQTPPKDEKNGKADKNAKQQEPTAKEGSPAGPNTAKTESAKTEQAPPPAAPAEPTNEKPVARAPLVWRQTTRTDFAKGQSYGVSVTTAGDLAITRTLKKLHTSTEGFIWSLVPDGKGGLYAGTGTQGQVLHIDPSGNSTVLARLPELSVHSLATSGDGVVWAATGPNGRTYKITPDGKFSVAYQAKEKYALALAPDGKGGIYVGTGGGSGQIYHIAGDGAAKPFFRTSEEHVLSLAVDKSGTIYAGTSSAGLVYRISPEGKGSVLYDAAEASISAIGVTSKGDIYAVTAPKGIIYRIGQDGAAKVVYDKAPVAFTSLRVGADDTVYAGGGSAVYVVRPNDTVAVLDNRTDIDILSLALGTDGTLYAGTGNVAEVYAAAPLSGRQSGSYDSVVHDAKQSSRWGAIRWTAATPSGTRLAIQTRTGDVAEPDSTWSAWSAPVTEPDGGRIASPAARFIQYRAVLESDTPGVSPTLRDVAITYLPRNQAPKVSFQTPAGGERWAKQQTVKWDASDPDKDTLSYELYYSNDFGAHWTPVPGPVKTAAAQPGAAQPAPTPAPVPNVNRPQSVADVQAILDKHPDMPATLRDRIIARAKALNEEFEANNKAAAATTTATPPAAGSSRETSKSLDTRTLPDGTYILKVVASDRASNPTDARTAEATSEPFVVCNAAPALFVFQAATKANGDRSVSLEGAAIQRLVAVSAVQYRIDGGEWTAAVPADGIFDGSMEGFTLTTAPLTPGKHTIEVKAYNAANGVSVEKVEIEVK